ncbi:MAG: pyridoxal-phosphate dependent enzyme [bacterium]|nr:pyridoxal-phosphate dependent enzyme [bacterium]
MAQSYFNSVVCLECGKQLPADMSLSTCPRCGSGWLDARYDYAAVAQQWPSRVGGRDRSLWRYGELLPIPEPNPEISLGEGFTPLIRLYQYERLFRREHLYVKDERHMPTNSFKDRQASMSVTAMKQAGVKECVLASTGNAAVAYAAFCARAGIKLWLFMSSQVPPEKMREVALYGAEVVKVSGTYDETKKVAAEFAQRKGIVMDKGARTIPAKESMKTLAYEIAEQLGLQLHPDQPGKWQAPDWYIQAVSGGIGPLGVWKGFSELLQMGLIDHMPKLGIVQAAGCAPMVTAYAENQPKAKPVVPKTLIHVLATGDPGYAYVLLREAVASNNGAMIAIEDGETFQAMRKVASRAGLSVEPATAVAFAGLEKMLREGIIAPEETVVVNCSGHTLPAEGHILGDQYDKYILSLEINGEAEQAGIAQEEGLGAALQNLDEQVTTVVIVDDNANDRRLIRRLLQSYKNYRVYEARNGVEALSVIHDRQPDLVVCDLTMPEMDGFGLLEKLKNDPATAHIPVVVVSAKALTDNDRKLLETYSESVWTKGGFDTRQLVDHVVDTLGHSPVEVIQNKRKPQVQTITSETAAVPAEDATTRAGNVIVMIEDNPVDLRLAKRMLKSETDFNVIEATTGREGLKAIYNYHPDLIILDLMLPDMDGFAIIETLQNDPKLRDIPVIIVSGRELSASERAGLQQNIRLTIEKASLDRNQLLNIIKDELR